MPLPLGKLLDGSPAPLDGVKRVAALDRVAACEQNRYRHDADGQFRHNYRMAMAEMTVSKYMNAGLELQLAIGSN